MLLMAGMAGSDQRRRPRDRKAQIISTAAELFHLRGFHAVTMEDISGAVGITAGALYRHFRNKQELLACTALDGLSAFEAVVDNTPPGEIEGFLRATAALALDRRELPVLWQRESRNLSDADRTRLRQRFRSIAIRTATILRGARPDLSAADAGMLVWAAFAVFASPSHYSVKLARGRFEDLLYAMSSTVVHTTLPAADDRADSRTPPFPSSTGRMARISRREVLMDVAVRLFDQRGYAAVSMEDIGAAAGISGAGIYNHVTAKSDLLVAALSRAAEALQLDASRVFATATSSRQALELFFAPT